MGGRHCISEYDALYTKEDQRAYVKDVIDKSPAAAAGITVGSMLIAINGRRLDGVPFSACMTMLKESTALAESTSLTLERGYEGQQRQTGNIMARVSSCSFSVGGFRKGREEDAPWS